MQPSAAAFRLSGSVTSPCDDLDAERGQARRAIGPADERADVTVLGAKRVDDARPDEARGAGDEDLHDSKFCQYRDGVGPRWPWYFEPSDAVPYGFEVGSLSCMKEIWPIFISW